MHVCMYNLHFEKYICALWMEVHVEFLKFEFFLKLLDFDADFVSGDL